MPAKRTRNLFDASLDGLTFEVSSLLRDNGQTNQWSPLHAASFKGNAQAMSLLERFLVNPAQTHHELCVKLGVLDELAAEIFALTVFLCDGLLQIKLAPLSSATPRPFAPRFFSIAAKLPMELQMLLCHRVVCSMKQTILYKDSEAAFRSLAKSLLVAIIEPTLRGHSLCLKLEQIMHRELRNLLFSSLLFLSFSFIPKENYNHTHYFLIVS